MTAYDVSLIRQDFPILKQNVHGHPLVYLDNAATSQKPQVVIDAILDYYTKYNGNVYRGVHHLSYLATQAYEEVREKVCKFINADCPEEIIFTRGTTTGINQLASMLGSTLQGGDEMALTITEHHSNLIPWQELTRKTGSKLVYLPLDQEGYIDLSAAEQLIGPQTKIVTVNHASNVLGLVQPIEKLARLVHQVGGVLIVDGAQAVSQMPVDVQALDVDFYVFSSHKMLGPTGVGVLYGKSDLLRRIEPAEFGGEMINSVGLYQSDWKDIPFKFEAGTPNIAGVIGLGAAIDYLNGIGVSAIEGHVASLGQYIYDCLQSIEGLNIYGPLQNRTGIISFTLEGVHPHDLATVLDSQGIAVRAGHHCCQPLMEYLKVPATLRASLHLYNNREDAHRFIKGIQSAKEFFG